jgi:hypothetical protein
MKKTRVAHPQMMKRDWINRRMMYWVMAPVSEVGESVSRLGG